MAVGATVSVTVTIASQVEMFPLTSVTVSVTVFDANLRTIKVSGRVSAINSDRGNSAVII